MKIEYDFDEVNWIEEGRNFDVKSDIVKNIIPERFDYYFKFFFPIGVFDEETKTTKRISHLQLAQFGEMVYDGKFGTTSFSNEHRGLPDDLVFMEEKYVETVEDISVLLGDEVDCIFHGVGDDILPEEFCPPWIIRGKMKDFKTIFESMNRSVYETTFFPNYIFEKNKGWCMGNMILDSGILILGCYQDTYEKITAQSKVEYIELNADSQYFEFRGRKKMK